MTGKFTKIPNQEIWVQFLKILTMIDHICSHSLHGLYVWSCVKIKLYSVYLFLTRDYARSPGSSYVIKKNKEWRGFLIELWLVSVLSLTQPAKLGYLWSVSQIFINLFTLRSLLYIKGLRRPVTGYLNKTVD